MDSLLLESKQKELELLRLLYIQKQSLSPKKIKQLLSIDTKQLHRLVDHINERLITQQLNAVIRKEEDTICLIVDDLFHFKRIYKSYYEESDYFRLLIEIFYHGSVRMDELSELLFLERTTISRKATKLRKIMQEYDIQLENRPLRLVGDEYNLLMFFTFMFWDIYGGIEWPFGEYVTRATVEKLYQQLDETFNLSIDASEQENIYFLLAVFLVRVQTRSAISERPNSFTFEVVQNNQNEYFERVQHNLQTFIDLQTDVAYFEQAHSHELLENDAKLLCFLLLQKGLDCYALTSELIFTKFNAFLKKSCLNRINCFIECLVSPMKLRTNQLEHLRMDICSIMLQTFPTVNSQIAKRTLQKFRSDYLTKQLLEVKEFTELYYDTIILALNRSQLLPENLSNKENFIQMISNAIFPYSTTDYLEKEIKVVLKLEAGPMYEAKIAELIQEHAPDNCQLVFQPEIKVETDLLVSDIAILKNMHALSDSKLVFVSFPIVEFDMKRVIERIRKIYQEKLSHSQENYRKEI